MFTQDRKKIVSHAPVNNCDIIHYHTSLCFTLLSLYSQLAQKVPLEVNPHTYDSSHTKTHILLQCHFGQLPLPSTDYNTDTKSVLDQAIRILQVSPHVVSNVMCTCVIRCRILLVYRGKCLSSTQRV